MSTVQGRKHVATVVNIKKKKKKSEEIRWYVFIRQNHSKYKTNNCSQIGDISDRERTGTHCDSMVFILWNTLPKHNLKFNMITSLKYLNTANSEWTQNKLVMKIRYQAYKKYCIARTWRKSRWYIPERRDQHFCSHIKIRVNIANLVKLCTIA